MTVTANDLDSVISCVMSGLLPLTDRDWSVRAGTLEWDCWHTAEHIGDCLLSYAWQLAVQPTARYVRAIATAEKDASPAEVLEFAVTGGRVLASMVRTSPAHVRAYHPAGARHRSCPGLSSGRDGRPGGFRRDGVPRGSPARQRRGAGLRSQPRSVARCVPPRPGPPVPAGTVRPGRRRPLDRAAVGRRPSRASRPPPAAELAPESRPAHPMMVAPMRCSR